MQIVDILELGERSLLSLVQEPERCRMRLDPNVKLPAKILQGPCLFVFIDSCCIYLLSLSLSASLLCCGDVEKNSSTPRASRNEFREKSSFPGRALCWKSEGQFCPYLPFGTDPASQILMPIKNFSHLCEFLGANWGNRWVGVVGSSVLKEN